MFSLIFFLYSFSAPKVILEDLSGGVASGFSCQTTLRDYVSITGAILFQKV